MFVSTSMQKQKTKEGVYRAYKVHKKGVKKKQRNIDKRQTKPSLINQWSEKDQHLIFYYAAWHTVTIKVNWMAPLAQQT